MDNKTAIYTYLNQNKYMALATSSHDGAPEVATVEYILDGDTLLINTFTYYRKYKNLMDNPRVACAVTINHDYTLQFEGTVEQLAGDEADSAKRKMLAEEPGFADFFNDDTRFFRITPTWMRLRDYTKEPMQEIEHGEMNQS